KYIIVFFFQAEDGIRVDLVTGVQTCALPIYLNPENVIGHAELPSGSGGSSACPISFSGFRWANRPGREIGAPFRLGLLDTTLAHGGVSPVCALLPAVPFWDPQFSSLMAWSSIGISSYHAAQFILRP